MKKHLQPLTPAALYARVSSDRQDVDLSVSTRLDEIENFHSTDTIDTKNSGTRGRSTWGHSSQVGMPDNSVSHNSLMERVRPLGTGVARARDCRNRLGLPELS